ncbi:MAG TPA: AAA family ATPase [Ktedonobacterales bacterium]
MTTHPVFGQITALVGRQREAALLWQSFEIATSGQMTVALVSGEPGIGKTRLLDELAAQAGAAGARTLRGAATEAEGMPPYLPFLEALGQYIRSAAPGDLREQTQDSAPMLASLLPELRARLGDLPAGYHLPPEQARLRLYEAVGDFLAALTQRQPLLLLLDDLQWADPATLDLLCYIVAHYRTTRMMLLGAYRAGEATHPEAFERTLATLHRQRALSITALDPLSAPEVALLAQSYLSGALEPSTSRLLSRQSEGNPFFVEELLRSWIESGVLARPGTAHARGDTWSMTTPSADESTNTELPSGILTTVRQRLVRLPRDTLDLLRAAAIIGRTFDVALLAQLSSRDAETVEEWLATATHAQLIHAVRPGTFSFAHDKIRECLYAEVTAARRTRLHAHIGHSLEALADPPDARRIADLAFHFTRSGDRERGVHYAQQAAESAMTAYAFEEAMAHYRDALQLLDGSDARRGGLLLALGEAAILAGSEREAMTILALAQTALRASGNLTATARASHGLGRAAWRLEDLPVAQAAFETTLALQDHAPIAEQVRVLVDLGTLLGVTMHRYEDGLAYGRRALALAKQSQDDHLIAPAARTVGNMLVRSNDLEAGIPLLEHALALASTWGDVAEAAECCACLVLAYLWSGDLKRMETVNEQRAEYARQCHDLHQMRHAHTMTAILRTYEGHLQETRDILAEAEQVIVHLADPEPLAFLRFAQGGIAYHEGDYAQAETLFDAACRMFRSIGPGALVWFLGWLALAHAHQHDVEAVRACVAELETLLADLPPNSMPVMEALIPMSQAAIVMGDLHLASRLYPRLSVFQAREGDFLPQRLLGEIAMLRRDWETAAAHLATAEALSRTPQGVAKYARMPELARTLDARAQLELARHGKAAHPHAHLLLQEAADLAERSGMRTEAGDMHGRIAALPPSPRGHRKPLPDRLTPREAEVLRLIAAGTSNQDIAAMLVLSVRTVERHISNIYAKIGAEGTASRAIATAYALRHELL